MLQSGAHPISSKTHPTSPYLLLRLSSAGSGGRTTRRPSIGNGLELDREPGSFLVREGGAYLGPAFLCFAVALVLFYSEDVEVGGRCRCWRWSLLAVGLGLIAIVHQRFLVVDFGDVKGNGGLGGLARSITRRLMQICVDGAQDATTSGRAGGVTEGRESKIDTPECGTSAGCA